MFHSQENSSTTNARTSLLPSCAYMTEVSLPLRRISSGDAIVTSTRLLLSILAPSAEYKISYEVSSRPISCTKPRGSLGNHIMCSSSAAAGWLKSVRPSVFIGRVNEEGEAQNSFVNKWASDCSRSLSSASSESRDVTSWGCSLTSELGVIGCGASAV